MRKPLLFDTQNPKISRFSTARAYKYKTKQQAKMKQRQKITFLSISHQSTYVRMTDHKKVKKIET